MSLSKTKLMTLGQDEARVGWQTPGPALAWIVCGLVVVAIAYIRFYLYPNQMVPLAYSLALLVCVWNRNRTILWFMTLAFLAMAMTKIFWVLPADSFPNRNQQLIFAVMHLLNIGVAAWAINALLNLWSELERQGEALRQLNAGLEASNEKLAARDEEVSTQNEELQAQAEELEQQSQELQAQTEELTRQAGDLQQHSEELERTNDELMHREDLLKLLLRLAGERSDDAHAMDEICHLCIPMIGAGDAAAVIESRENRLSVRACFGGEAATTSAPTGPSFESIVLDQGRTACIEDVDLRPDLSTLLYPTAGRVRSILATPLRSGCRTLGVLEIVSTRPRQWTARQFRIIEWIAAQTALIHAVLHLEQQLHEGRREAEAASERKTRFLAAISHDIRTPANAITLLADLIAQLAQECEGGGEIVEMSRQLQASSRAMVELVSDVLDLTRFDSGAHDLHEEGFILEQLIQAEVRKLQPVAQSKGLVLSANLSMGSTLLITDRLKLMRVISNLLANAIKFTDAGRVSISTTAGETGIELQIADTGIGIPPEHVQHIFDEFFQLRNPERDRSKGNGLGLAICKRLVDALGCRLSVQSVLAQGTSFTLHIPRRLLGGAMPVSSVSPCTTQSSTAPSPASDSGKLKGLRVLLVEDHHVTRMATERLLSGEGAHVICASGGRQALGLLEHENPNVLLLDMMLPDLDGREVLRQLQSSRPSSLQRALVVTGDATASRKQEAIDLGADQVIVKPLHLPSLLDEMHLCRERATASEGNDR